jgi:hypothetical protein
MGSAAAKVIYLDKYINACTFQISFQLLILLLLHCTRDFYSMQILPKKYCIISSARKISCQSKCGVNSCDSEEENYYFFLLQISNF